MSIDVLPEGWEPPTKYFHWKPEPPPSVWCRKGSPRPEIAVALDNPGLWVECDWDPEIWKQPDSLITQRRVRCREVWHLRKRRDLGKLWLRYDGLSDD